MQLLQLFVLLISSLQYIRTATPLLTTAKAAAAAATTARRGRQQQQQQKQSSSSSIVSWFPFLLTFETSVLVTVGGQITTDYIIY